MDWILEVEPDERVEGALTAEALERACSSFRLNGAVILRGVFSGTILDRLHAEFKDQFGALGRDDLRTLAKAPAPNPLLKVGDDRFDALPQMKGAFADPAVIANPLLLSILRKVLGRSMRMAGFTVVISCPGAKQQNIHRDHPQLYAEGHLGTVLPTYAVNISVPLIDVDLAVGPTGVWLGSHRWPDSTEAQFVPAPETMTAVPFRRGDAVMLDYRLHHSGLANRSEAIRPLLYMAYARTWFYDEPNHQNRASLNMAESVFKSLPDDAREVMFRVHVEAMRAGVRQGGLG